jgi:hypothetical protein
MQLEGKEVSMRRNTYGKHRDTQVGGNFVVLGSGAVDGDAAPKNN